MREEAVAGQRAQRDEPMQLEIRPDERTGAAIGGMFLCALVVLLAGRVAFGAPARAYFRSGLASGKPGGDPSGPDGAIG